jgi:hypothetical protein
MHLTTFARTRLVRYAVVMLMMLGKAASAQGLPPVWQNWLNQLTSSGYGIVQGSSTLTSVSYCQQVIVPVFGTCFNSDPGDPYVVPLVPVGNGYVDTLLGGFAAQKLSNGTVVGEDFRLDQTEAELIIVKLPPLAGYFSYQGYVFSRLASDYPYKVTPVPPDPSRAELYASYNNSINNTIIKAKTGLSFGEGYAAFLSTANSALSADMTTQFSAVGGDPSLILTDPIGSNVGVGLGANNDDFSMLLRYLVPSDPVAGNDWLNNAASNVLVYRIAQPASLNVTRYGNTPLQNRAYNTNETVYASDVTELSTLMKNWLKTQEKKNKFKIRKATATMTADANGAPTAGSVGPICIEKGHLCNGDEQDAIHWAVAIGALPDQRLFVMAGVNTAATNNTTSFGLALEDATIKTGVLTINQTNPAAAGFSTGTVTGSAELALKTLGLWSQASPALQNDAPNLYVQIFTRGCTAQQTYCGQTFTTVIPSTTIPFSDAISIFQRAYALPGYTGGPNPRYVIAPNAIF